MKPIVIDFLRRWWWLYVLGFVLALVNDVFAISPNNHVFAPYFFATILGPVFVLGADLVRGAAGVHFILPIAKRKIGISYWIVGVCVPTILSSLALVAAILTARIFQLSHPIGWGQLPLTVIASFLIAGSVFLLLTMFNAAPQKGLWNNVLPVAAGGLWGASMFSPIFLKQLLELRPGDTVTIAALTVLGLLLTIIGWLRAEQIVVLRARKRVATHRSIRESGARPAQMETGISGLPYLFLQSVKFALGMAVVLMFFGALFRSLTINSMFVTYTLVICALLPSLRYFTGLRHLRALPVSIDRVAFIILALPLLNFLVCLGVILTTQAVLAPGAFKSGPQLPLIAGLASFGNSLVVRFGPKSLPWVLGIGIMVLFAFTDLLRSLPVAGLYTIAALLMIAAYGIIRLSLRSSDSYRLPAATYPT